MVIELRKNYPGLTVEKMKSGKQRIRVRVEGKPNSKIRLNVPMDHPKFSEHYWAARGGLELPAEPESNSVRRSLQWLTDKYLYHLQRMVEAGQTSPATLRQRKSLLTRMCTHKHTTGDLYGEMNLDAPQSAFIAVRDARAATPAEADNMMKAARAMYKWACDTDMAKANPLVGMAKIHKSKGGATAWTSGDLKKFREVHPIGTMAHLALTVHMFTAARSGDAIWLGRGQEFERDGMRWLGWQPTKRGAAFVEVPMSQPLRKAIASVARIGDAFILSDHGTPYKTPDSYRNRFRKWCDEAGLKGRSSHGVRKAMAELLAEEGCSENQIMAVLSHTQPSTSAIYTKGANRRALAADAMRAVEGFDW